MNLIRRAAVAISAAWAMVLGTMSAADAAPATAGIAAFSYAGTWEGNSTQKWSNVTGSTATVAVTAGAGGSRFDLRGFRALNHGYAGVSVDGGPETRINYYGTRGDGVRWSTTLAAGAHTVKVRVLGTRDPRSSGTLVNVTGAYLSNGTFGQTPPPTPTPTPTPPGTVPVPAHFAQTPSFSENFDRTATLGSFRSVYSNWGHYDGSIDTSGHGRYDTNRVVSVSGGILRKNLHSEGGQPLVAALLPPVAPDVWGGTRYGRYEVTFRYQTVDGYKIAWLLWPSDGSWSNEVDFPEGNLDGQGFYMANLRTNGAPTFDYQSPKAAAAPGAMHTAILEWTPTELRGYIDGRLVAQTTASVPQQNMRWVLQTETEIPGPTPTNTSGVLEVDSVVYRAYTG